MFLKQRQRTRNQQRGAVTEELAAANEQEVKRSLQAVYSIPETHRRLVFSNPSSGPAFLSVPEAFDSSTFSGVQVVLYSADRSIGRLVSPSIREEPRDDLSSPDISQCSALRLCYSAWQPVAASSRALQPVQPLHLKWDFAASCVRAKVLGRLNGEAYAGPEFALGPQVAASASLQLQRLDYIRQQQLKYKSLNSTSTGADHLPAVQATAYPQQHTVVCGQGLGACELTLSLDGNQAWLNQLAFDLAYLVTPRLNATQPNTHLQHSERTATQDTTHNSTLSCFHVDRLTTAALGQPGRGAMSCHSAGSTPCDAAAAATSSSQRSAAASCVTTSNSSHKHSTQMCEAPSIAQQHMEQSPGRLGQAGVVDPAGAPSSSNGDVARPEVSSMDCSSKPDSSAVLQEGAAAAACGQSHGDVGHQNHSAAAAGPQGGPAAKRKQQQHHGRSRDHQRRKAAAHDGNESDVEADDSSDGPASDTRDHRMVRAAAAGLRHPQHAGKSTAALAAFDEAAAAAAAAATAALSSPDGTQLRPGRSRGGSPNPRGVVLSHSGLSSSSGNAHAGQPVASVPLQFGDLPPYIGDDSPRGGAESDQGPCSSHSPTSRSRGRGGQPGSSPGQRGDGSWGQHPGSRRRSLSLGRAPDSRPHGAAAGGGGRRAAAGSPSPSKERRRMHSAHSLEEQEQLAAVAAAAAAAAVASATVDKDSKGQRATQNGRLSSTLNGKYVPPALLLQQQQQQLNGKLTLQPAASDSALVAGRHLRLATSPRHRHADSSPSPRAAVHRECMPDNAGESLVRQISPELLARYGLGVSDCNGHLMMSVRQELAASVPDLLLEGDGLPSAEQLMSPSSRAEYQAQQQQQPRLGSSSCQPSPRPGSTRRQQQQQQQPQPRSAPASPLPGTLAAAGALAGPLQLPPAALVAGMAGSEGAPGAGAAAAASRPTAVVLAQQQPAAAAAAATGGSGGGQGRGGQGRGQTGAPAAPVSSPAGPTGHGQPPGLGPHPQQPSGWPEVWGMPGEWAPAAGLDHLDSMSDPGSCPGSGRGGRARQGRQGARVQEARGGGRKGGGGGGNGGDFALAGTQHPQQAQHAPQRLGYGQGFYGPGAGISRSAASTPFEPGLALQMQQQQQQLLQWDPAWAAHLGYGLPFELPQAAPTPPFPAAAALGGTAGAAHSWPGAPSANVPATDMQRFLASVTPCLQVDPAMSAQQVLQKLTLGDVWQMFQEPSFVGAPVVTLGGARGSSTAYYVPYLSAIQLFTLDKEQQQQQQQEPSGDAADANGGAGSVPSSSTPSSSNSSPELHPMRAEAGADVPGSASDRTQRRSSSSGSASSSRGGAAAVPQDTGPGPGRPGQLYATSVEGWPAHMRLMCQHVEVELPFSRDPLFIQLQTMAAPLDTSSPPAGSSSSSNTGPYRGQPTPPPAPVVGRALLETPLSEVHPASWFAVAWYPLYRIPDAPLTARFLAFYSFAQPLQALYDAAAAGGSDGGSSSDAHRESQGTAAASAGSSAGAGCGLRSLQLPVVGIQWYNQMAERWKECLVEVQGPGPASSIIQVVAEHPAQKMDRELHLEELQAGAASLARGQRLYVVGPKGRTAANLYHNDFEFFNVRCA